MDERSRRIAYLKGWHASERYGRTTSTQAWDADRYYDYNKGRNGEMWADLFEAGWMDYAADNVKYEHFT